MSLPYTYKVIEVVKVIDADTIRVELDLGFHMRYVCTARLYGINAPEVRGPEREEGKAATECLKEIIEGAELWCRTLRDSKKQQGKYGRWLIDLFAKGEGGHINCNLELIRRGHAKPYMADYANVVWKAPPKDDDRPLDDPDK